MTMITIARRSSPLPLLAAAVFALPSLVQAAPRFAVRISDHHGAILIAGEAAAPREHWIEVSAFGSGVQRGLDGLGNPVPGACSLEGFTFRKRVDKSTPLLQHALSSGLLLPAVQAVYLGTDETPRPGLEPVAVTLRHVQVTGYRLLGLPGGSAGEAAPRPTEEITLNYTEVEWTYLQTGAHGQVIDRSTTTLANFQAINDPTFDDDHDGLPNDLDDDDDSDGIKDEEELAGGSNPFLNDAHEDLDGDGQDNLAESVANTRPNDASDYFGIRRITHRLTPDGLQVTVSFPVSDGRRYRLLASPDPSIPREFWMVLDSFEVPAGSPESGADLELNPNVLRNSPQLFFAADVERLPSAL